MQSDLIISKRNGLAYRKPQARIERSGNMELHYPPNVRKGEIVEQYTTQSANPKTPNVAYVQTFRTQRHGDSGDERERWDCGCASAQMLLQKEGPTYICKHLQNLHARLAAERQAQRAACATCRPHHSAEEKQRAYEELFGA